MAPAKETFLSRLLRLDETDYAVFSIAVPNIVSNVSTPLVGLVGTYVAGHLGDDEKMAGIGLGTSSFNLVYMVFIFLQKGTTGLTAQAKGAGQFAEVRACAARFIGLGLLLGIVLLSVRDQIRSVIFTYLLPPPSDEAADAAHAYFNARLMGAPAAFGNFAVQGWLNGMQQPTRVLTQQMVLNIVNSVSCFTLALTLGYGASGVGMADAVAQTTAFIFGFIQVVFALRGWPCAEKLPGRWELKAIANVSSLKEGAVLSTNILLRSVCISIVTTSFSRIGSTFGSAILSANVIIAQMQTLMSYGVDGFSNACEALVGEAIGCKSPEDLRKAVFSSFKWGFFLSLAFCIVYTFLGPSIFSHMTTSESVVQACMDYHIWLSVAPMLTVWSYLLDGVYVGATLSFEMVSSMVVCAIIYCIVLYLGVFELQYRNHGLLAAFYTFQVMRGITLGRQYHKVRAKAEPLPVTSATGLHTALKGSYEKLPRSEDDLPKKIVSMPQPPTVRTQSDQALLVNVRSRSERNIGGSQNYMRDLLTLELGPDVPENIVRQVTGQVPEMLNSF